MLFVLNKIDLVPSRDTVEAVKEKYGGAIDFVPFSSVTLEGEKELRRKIFDVIEIIRVYTKVPGKKPDMDAPFVLPRGSTVMELAREIHKDIAEGLRYARIWGSAKFDGQTVQKDYVLQDGDILLFLHRVVLNLLRTFKLTMSIFAPSPFGVSRIIGLFLTVFQES